VKNQQIVVDYQSFVTTKSMPPTP